MKKPSSLVFKLKILMVVFCLSFTSLVKAEDLYKTLGVPSAAEASQIKKAWKSLVLQFHPDRFMNDPEAAQAATEKLKVINAAENVLGNPALRAYYDFLSNGGKNYERWANVPGNTNLETMAKRFGPPESLQSRNPFAAAAPPPKPQPQPQPQPRPSPQAQKTDRFDQLLASLGDANLSALEWKEAYRIYLSETGPLTDSNRQIQFLQLLKLPLENWKAELLLQAIVTQFQTVDESVSKTLLNIVYSNKENYRRYGVALLQNVLIQERTSDFFKMDFASAKSLLLSRMQDPLDTVRARAVRAIRAFAFSEQKDIATSIRALVFDRSFEVAWEAQQFLSEGDKLSLPENFLPFLQYLEKYQSEPLNSAFTYQRADKNDAVLPLVKMRQMNAVPMTPEIEKILARLATSSNQNLANIASQMISSKTNVNVAPDVQTKKDLDESTLKSHMQEVLQLNSYFEKMPVLNTRLAIAELLQIIGQSSNLSGIISELQFLKESTSLPEVRDQAQEMIQKTQAADRAIHRCETLFTN